jgi:glucose/arabinose dehydrogenase
MASSTSFDRPPTGAPTKVARYRFEDDRLVEEAVVLEGIVDYIFHDGGRIQFGPDGALYVSTGDATLGDPARYPGSLNGKMLRLTDFRGETGTPEIVSLGHRNVQGFDWQPGTDLLVATAFGPDANDEVNIIREGADYGWPDTQGDDSDNGSVPALVDFDDNIVAPSGATFVSRPGSAWSGNFLFACLRGQQLRRLVFDGEQVIENEALFEGEFGRLRTVVEGPDGALYVLTNNTDGRGEPREGDDRILRIVPPSA